MELALYREYRDVVGLFSYVVETERRFYLANNVDLQVRSAGGEVFFELTLADAWVWDVYRSARFVKQVRVVTFKDVNVEDGSGSTSPRRYVSVDGGMSDNIRPALYGSDYTARIANRKGSDETKLCRVVGMHCESGDILVNEVRLPADIKRGDILAVPVTGAYGRTMASNYNQALIPAVVGVGEAGAHVMIRRQTIDDLLSWDVSE